MVGQLQSLIIIRSINAFMDFGDNIHSFHACSQATADLAINDGFYLSVRAGLVTFWVHIYYDFLPGPAGALIGTMLDLDLPFHLSSSRSST